MHCECGCGLGDDEDAEDEVTQFCIEEAALIYYDAYVAAQQDVDTTEDETRPGQITDPAVADAMAKAKELHAATFGVQV